MAEIGSIMGENLEAAVPRDELEATIRAHELFIANKSGGRRAKFFTRNLAGADLSNRTLSEADFSGAVLYGANLRFADLRRANMYCADLRNVDGRCSNFSHADMRGATLNGSNLSQAILDHADFRGGRLARQGLWGKEEVIDRNGAASGVNFSFCSLRGASFEGANLSGANFSGAVIQATKFKGARLGDATFEGAVLTEVDMSELAVPASALKNCVLPPSPEVLAEAPHLLAKLQAHQRWVDTDARAGTSAIFDGKDLRPLADVIGRFKLTAIAARRVIAVGVDFSCTELQGADFEGADLRGASFESADLRGANFRNACLHHAKFIATDLRTLQLHGGGLRPCDFTGAALSDGQIADAIVD
ncbi:MAG: pentapeptide repeat-containing protein [Alphaproteobacteria bacterium]|nr:pentapeptide repeat-containing protein [Alphaproteobacteria bacterium]MDE2498780.1 pentapeptide repeat-containing protein [Alphaproteobacteria bacterium]